MSDPNGRLGLPPAPLRPRWCRSPEASDRWLPWDVHATLEALNGAHRYLTSGQLTERSGIGVGSSLPAVADLEDLGLIKAEEAKDLFPHMWEAQGHDEHCGCRGPWYYSLTPRGRLWLETYPARPRPSRWKRPGFWVSLVLCGAVGWLIGTLIF